MSEAFDCVTEWLKSMQKRAEALDGWFAQCTGGGYNFVLQVDGSAHSFHAIESKVAEFIFDIVEDNKRKIKQLEPTKMEPGINVRDIIKKWLKDNGYDGLYSSDYSCGCSLENFISCDESWVLNCQPGYKVPCEGSDHCQPGECEFHIGPKKENS